MAFYLKYRSQTLSQLDIKPVREALTRILKAKQLPHAFLFSGPKGTGKTSAARILAKAVNCEAKNPKPKTPSSHSPEPCNHCSTCLAITAGSHLDIVEMDAASHRGIDDIRELRERIGLAPSSSRFRVYIIDEVHMLTTEAFNALLKTLEEPPAHAIFVLCTTQASKLPDTVISRCTQIKFRQATQEEIVNSLKRVTKAEKLVIADPALKLIAEYSSGSFRDAQKLLEQLSLNQKEITPQLIKNQLGTISTTKVVQLLNLFHTQNVQECLPWIEQVADEGADLILLTRQCLELVHQMLLKKHGVKVKVDDLPQLSSWTADELHRLASVFAQVIADTKTALIPQLPLEIAAVEWAGRGEVSPLSRLEVSAASPSYKKKSYPAGSFSGALAREGGDKDLPKKPAAKPRQSQSKANSQASLQAPPPPNLSFQVITDRWSQVLAAVRPKNHSVEGLLRSTRPKALKGSDLVLEVFYRFHLNQLKMAAKRTLVEEAIEEVFSSRLNLIYQLGQRPPAAASSPQVAGQSPEFSQRPASPPESGSTRPGPAVKPSPLASPSEEEQDLAAIAAEIFGT